jgi:hypothetical protein
MRVKLDLAPALTKEAERTEGVKGIELLPEGKIAPARETPLAFNSLVHPPL